MKQVTLGKIINVRGLKGEVKVKSFTDFASLRYKKGNELLLVNEETSDELLVHVKHYSNSGEMDYLIFDEISDVDSANKYRNYFVRMSIDNLPKLKDSYYYHELIGMDVYMNDKCYGKVEYIREDTAQRSLVVAMSNGKKEIVPFVKAFIDDVDVDSKKIVIKYWEGLFNEN